jgi:hypothetical protein
VINEHVWHVENKIQVENKKTITRIIKQVLYFNKLLDVLSNTIYIIHFISAMYIEPLQVLTYFGGYPEPQNNPVIKQNILSFPFQQPPYQ